MAKTPEEIVLFENKTGSVTYMLHRNQKDRIQIDVFNAGMWNKMNYKLKQHDEFYLMSTDIIHLDER